MAGTREIDHELKRLGQRKRPPFTFLPRNHVINKYMGKILARIHLR